MKDDEVVTLTKSELKDIVREAAEEAVEQAFIKFGIDAHNPLRVQGNMQYLDSLREGSSKWRLAVLTAAIGSGITALGTLLYLGFRALVGSHD